jgi:acyl-CoA thioester hydrolase
MQVEKTPVLTLEKPVAIRFNEVDMMGVVWHGAYPVYLEDAREAFGAKFGLSYQLYIDNRTAAPVVDLHLSYRRPLRYGMHPVVRITYRPCAAAKILFDYEIVDADSGDVVLTASSVQVFTDLEGSLLWDSPAFYEEWKTKVGLL